MDLLPLEDGGLRFLEMPKGFYDQLAQLPELCDADDDPLVAERLAPSPMDPEEDPKLRAEAEEDWESFVQPELDAAHDRAMQVVMEDLAAAKPSLPETLESESQEDPEEPHFRLDIPGDHLDQWFHVLNRARIVMAMTHRLPISENPPDEGEQLSLQRLFAAHLSDSLAHILELLVVQMSRDLP